MNINDIKKLGRLHSVDERDGKYPMRALLPQKLEEKTFKYWCPNMWWEDQGQTPKCVAFSWAHWLAEGSKTQPLSRKYHKSTGGEPFNTDNLYNWAQQVDEWEGTNYDGTSVRAGARVLKNYNFIESYHWASSIDDITNTLLHLGPVVVGTNWYYDMFYPNQEGIISVNGQLMGGHAYLLDGINIKKGLIRIKNSWGKSWGHRGFAYITIADMEKLLGWEGEACIAVEINKE